MKARYSEEYLRSTWATLIQETPDGDYMNFEDELNYRMSVYKELPTEAFKAVEKIEAQKIIEKATGTLKETMNMINDIEAGRKSLGYTTQIQETQEMHRMILRFEFNCLQLSDFKKAHN